MSVIKIRQVIATHQSDWVTGAPDTRWTEHHRLEDGRIVEVENRYWSTHNAFRVTGQVPPLPFPMTDNTRTPNDCVLQRQLEELEHVAKDCDVIYWQHAHACYPTVAQHLKRLFKQSILYFGDDCPGSSEIKTFPVARFFDALIYSMLVWNGDTGEHAATKYAEQGLSRSYWYPMSTSNGVMEWITKNQFMPLEATVRPFDLVWVGNAGFTTRRQGITAHMVIARGAPDLNCKLYGFAMPDGELDSRARPDVGFPCAALYSYALCGANVAESSIFNCRLQDLWETGVIQIVNDAHHELAEFGFVDGEHYLSWDGSAQHLMDRIRWCKTNARAVEKMRLDAFMKRRAFASTYNHGMALARAYADFLK